MRTKYNAYVLSASIGLLTLLIYLPALRSGFVYWDDNLYIFENPYIRSLDGAFFRWAFAGFHVSNWHPLTWISHAVDYAIWGLNPLGHHLTSIILHAVNASLVVMLVMQLLQVAREAGSRGSSTSFLNDRTVMIAAGVTGLLFGIHPVHVESVAWVSERKDLLCALFFLLSIMSYVRAVRGAEATGGRLPMRALVPALGLFVLALLSKPMAVTLPVVLLIMDWYPLGRIRSFMTFRVVMIEKLPFITLSAVSAAVTIAAQGAGTAFQTMGFVTPHIRVLVAATSLMAYLGKMLLPVHLLPFYPYPREVSLFSVSSLSSILLVITVTAGCMLMAKKQKVWLSAWGYYVITLLPVLGIVQVGGQAMADRYTYLPSLGPFLLAGLGAAWVAEKVTGKYQQSLSIKSVSVLGALFLAFTLSVLTIVQTAVWHDSISLWTSVIEKGTEKLPMAYVNRGAAYQKEGRLDRSLADYETAIALDPSDVRAYISLGIVYDSLGQLDKAMTVVDRAIALAPSSSEAHRNRGILLEKMLQLDGAVDDFTRAIALKPSSYEAYTNRGVIYAKMGHYDKAIADYDQAIAINPRHFSAYTNRGISLTLTGQNDKALEDFDRAIELGQDDALAYYNRGMFFRRMGNPERTLADVRRACDLGNQKACSVYSDMTPGAGVR